MHCGCNSYTDNLQTNMYINNIQQGKKNKNKSKIKSTSGLVQSVEAHLPRSTCERMMAGQRLTCEPRKVICVHLFTVTDPFCCSGLSIPTDLLIASTDLHAAHMHKGVWADERALSKRKVHGVNEFFLSSRTFM